MADNNLEKFQNQNPLQQHFLNKFFFTIQKLFKKIPKKTNVIDVGCGEGFTIRTLKKISPDSSFVGVDPDVKALGYAKGHDPHSSYQEGSIFSLPFPDNSFDIALCNEVLEHVAHPGDAIKELLRVTRGYIIFSVPHEPLFRLSNLLRGRNITRFGNYPYHLHTWSTRGFKRLLSRFVEIKETKTPFPWTVILAKKRNE